LYLPLKYQVLFIMPDEIFPAHRIIFYGHPYSAPHLHWKKSAENILMSSGSEMVPPSFSERV